MKKLLLVTAIIMAASAANAEYVRGYNRSDGTYVQPHYRTAPDNSMYNNYSTQGNQNPYTGREGYVDPNRQYQQPTYDYDNQRERTRSSYR